MMMNDRLLTLLKEFEAEQSSVGHMSRDSRVLLIDGLNLFIGAFSASPAMNARGEHIGGLKGFLSSIFFMIMKFKPTRCVIAFDGHDAGAVRRKIYPEYKAGRKSRIRLNRQITMLDEGEALRHQLVRLEQYLKVMPITVIMLDYIEADDVIGSIVCDYYSGEENEIIIASSDKDFLQLITKNVKVYRTTQKKIFDEAMMVESYGIPAYNFLTYRTVSGDVSDNLPGVTGIGLKSLIKLFPEIVGDVVTTDDLIKLAQRNIDAGSKLKSYKKIIECADKIGMNKRLMQLTDVEIPDDTKLEIKDRMYGPVGILDPMRFRVLLQSDGLHEENGFTDSKAILTLSQLNYYAQSKI